MSEYIYDSSRTGVLTMAAMATDEKLAMLIDWKENMRIEVAKFVEMMRTNPLPAVDAEARAGMWARQTKALEEETNAYMFALQARKALQDSITDGSPCDLDI